MPILELRQVSHRYRHAPSDSLHGVSLRIGPAESVAVVGPSGSGKSTLLAVAALLTPPSGGDVLVDGKPIEHRSQASLTRLRRSSVGVLFQDAHLIRHLSVIENVVVPVLSRRRSVDGDLARELLEFVGLRGFEDRMPGTLSGGQAQRVALCRALANRPKLIVADEPTASLDEESAALIRNALARVGAYGASVLVATHDRATAAWATRRLRMESGRLTTIDGEGER